MTAPFENEHNTGDSKEKTPHAGQSHQPADIFDRPPREFKSDLEDAKNEGLVGSDPTVFEELGVPPLTEEAIIPENELDTSPEIQERINRVTAKAVETEEKPKWHQKTAIKVGGGLLALATAAGLGASLASSDNSPNTTIENSDSPTSPDTTTPNETTTTLSNSPVETGNLPSESLPQDIELPSSETPELLAEQLYINLQNALNTNNSAYLDFRYAGGTESELASEVMQNMQEAADYRNQGNPDYGYVFETSVINFTPEDFSSTDNVRKLTVAVTETEILDSSGASREYNYVHDLSLRKVQKFVDTGNGPESVDVWLISQLDHQGNVVAG